MISPFLCEIEIHEAHQNRLDKLVWRLLRMCQGNDDIENKNKIHRIQIATVATLPASLSRDGIPSASHVALTSA